MNLATAALTRGGGGGAQGWVAPESRTALL